VRVLHVDFSGISVPPGADEGFEVGEAEVVFRGWCTTCRRADGAELASPTEDSLVT
jgi:hypothetical protein